MKIKSLVANILKIFEGNKVYKMYKMDIRTQKFNFLKFFK
jgi:hypothetical protein